MAFTVQDPATRRRLGHVFATDSTDPLALIQRNIDVFNRLDPRHPKRIVIAEVDPKAYLCGILAACQAQIPVFLANPRWQQREWDQALACIGSGYVQSQGLLKPFGQPQAATVPFDDQDPLPWILIPTGGSSGQIRFAIHTWETLAASVAAFQTHSQLEVINSVCVLPVCHISGLIQMMRCLLTSGHLYLQPWSTFTALSEQDFNPSSYCLSLVPTQLYRLLAQPDSVSWLRRFQLILLGGGPTSSGLLDQARQAHLPLALTYGLTETASQIATLQPHEFLAGANSCGRTLPHAQVDILDAQGQPQSLHDTGVLRIRTRSLALGYYPDVWDPSQPFETGDLGYINAEQHLVIVGRVNDLIITGGEKVLAPEVEAVILASGLVQDSCVVGRSDPEWGQVMVAVYASSDPMDPDEMKAYLNEYLVPYKHPKDWIRVPILPRNAQGKVNRTQLLKWVESSMADPL